MQTRLILVLLCTLCAGSLFADFVGNIDATFVSSDRKALDGVKIVVEPDPMWGFTKQDDFDKFKRERGPFPKVELSSEAVSDANGAINIPLSVKTSGEGKLPKVSITQDRKSINVDYVVAKITISKDGYRTIVRSQWVTDGKDDLNGSWQMTMTRRLSFQANLVHMSDRSPVANAKVLVIGTPGRSRPRNSAVFEVSTDTNGVLKLSDEQCSSPMKLRMLEDGLAFAMLSSVWQGLRLNEGPNDGGTLVVVPGGAIKLHTVHADTGEDLPPMYTLRNVDPQARFVLTDNFDAGEVVLSGIPVGTYNVSAYTNGPFFRTGAADIDVKAGEVTDVGELKFEPHRSIEVFAVDETGGGIQAFSVTAEQISGFHIDPRWFGEVNRKDPGPWRVGKMCTAEQNKVEQLARGRWKITVEADGFSPGSVELDVPASDPIFVKLSQGGKLTVTADKGVFQWGAGFEKIVAIERSAPAWKSLKGRSGAEIVAMIDGVDSTGVFIAANQWHDAKGFSALPPGTYTVIARVNEELALRSDDVVIKKGETTDLVMTNAPCRLTVTVSDNGKPLARELIYAVPAQSVMGQDAPKTVSASADANGVAVFEGLASGTYQVMTKRQHDWVNSGNNSWGGRRGLPNGAAPSVKVGYGDRIELEVDTYQPYYVWVTVKIKKGKNVTASDVKLTHLQGRVGLNEIKGNASGDTFEFGMLARGEYELSATAGSGINGRYKLLRLLRVDQPPEQTFDVDLNLGSLEVKVKPPKGFEGYDVTVYLKQAYEEAWASFESPGAGGNCDQKGSIKFENLPEGPYRVVAWAAKDRGGFTFTTSEEIEVKGSKKVSLKFDERVGGLELRFDDSVRFELERPMRVELLDGDKLAEMGDPQRFFRQNTGATLSAVAKGKYTLRISVAGYELYSQDGVEIQSGQMTFLSVKLTPMCRVEVLLKGKVPADVGLRRATIDYLDASGNAIDVGDVDPRLTFWRGGTYDAESLVFTHVPAKCARIRCKLEGFKELVVDVKPDRNKPDQVEATLQPE